MKTNVSILFYMKRPKTYLKGPAPIYIRITVDGKRSELSSGRDCEPEDWSSKIGRSIGKKDKAKSLNNYLDTLRHKLVRIHHEFLEADKPITSEAIKDRFSGKEESSKSIIQLIGEHNVKMEALIGNGFEANTLRGYKTTEKHLKTFLKTNYKKEDLDIRRLDHTFIENYEFFLRAEIKCSGVSAAKYIKHLKKIVNHALANKWLKENPFLNYKSTAKPKEREFLTTAELKAIMDKRFTIERLALVRDVFVFCCYTGLSYADVKKLNRNEVGIGVDGEKWIFTARQKTATPSRIPILPIAQKIVDKYDSHPECEYKNLLLPVLSNQKMNAYLKEIADIAGVDKHLTFHLARHTFATTVTLSNGVPIETVSKMLGHTDLKTTQHYAKTLDVKISDDMRQLRAKVT